jgi:hypothetical protein
VLESPHQRGLTLTDLGGISEKRQKDYFAAAKYTTADSKASKHIILTLDVSLAAVL